MGCIASVASGECGKIELSEKELNTDKVVNSTLGKFQKIITQSLMKLCPVECLS